MLAAAARALGRLAAARAASNADYVEFEARAACAVRANSRGFRARPPRLADATRRRALARALARALLFLARARGLPPSPFSARR